MIRRARPLAPLLIAALLGLAACNLPEPLPPPTPMTFGVGSERIEPATQPPPLRTATPRVSLTPPPTASQEPTSRATEARSATPARWPYFPPTDVPTATLGPLNWEEIAPGVERVYTPIPSGTPGQYNYAYTLRLDPSEVTFKIHYERDNPRQVGDWGEDLDAQIVFNGGFFSGLNTPVGRVVLDGELFGFALNYGEDSIGVAGVFSVLDGEVAMYSIGRGTYSPRGMRFDEAVESYPVLLLPGNQPAYPEETNEAARRTVIGIDNEGWVVVMVVDLPIFTLHQLGEWLAVSGLNLDSALNLDGGRSSGISVATPGEQHLINSVVNVPIVLAVTLDDP
jgi:uncharacterized protein YigE (DUF2233 family)